MQHHKHPHGEPRRPTVRILHVAVLYFAAWMLLPALCRAQMAAGVARVDITPAHPVRLSGYGGRRAESEGVEQRLWAKALALRWGDGAPALLLAVDSIGVPAYVTEEVARRLRAKSGLPRERFTLASTHTHTAPCLGGVLKTLFGVPVPPDHQERIDRYTAELTQQLEAVALSALADLRPAALSWARGEVRFAGNRRTRGGPVDHDLGLLRVEGPGGALHAVVANYACHCTSLGGDFNRVCGDWAGFAQEEVEKAHPDATALVVIGCGADADPYPRTGLQYAKQHGAALADEVERLLAMPARPLRGPLGCALRSVRLEFEEPPSRAELETRAKREDAVGYHARVQLERLDRGEALQRELEYPVQAWSFGEDLAWVFLAGEVVVDYSLRLKRELDRTRLCVSAYSNDVPCYIPSRRILAEGGYEAEGAMTYYDRPGRLKPAVEERIVNAVHAVVPASFLSEESRAERPPPLSPEAALAAFQLGEDLRIELVASEPLVVDPVAVDFGLNGRVWVVEMHDYPTGLDGNWRPGGRVRVLEDSDGDGRLDRGVVFLDDLPFPTGIQLWRRGALVCAAPEVLYAEDTDGDGKADLRRTLLSGFATHNYQARVNGLRWGLDNWVHGANGLLGGTVRSEPAGTDVDLGARDFRIRPDTGEFEPAAGLSQQGLAHDDWGNWFGNENWFLLRHYPLPDHYLRRNPHVKPPNPRVDVPSGPDPNRLFPRSRVLERFNDPSHAGRVTSACGPCIYRGGLLGSAYEGDAFVCEPVHNLVHRLKLAAEGVTIRGTRVPGEEDREFLASTDNWFRPVEVRTGPDGALWVVDMYRFVIEHPRWIPPERLERLDVRAGADRGRIWRILPRGTSARTPRGLERLGTADLARALESPNGALRDLIHREVVHRGGTEAREVLVNLARVSQDPTVRLQALCALDGLAALDEDVLRDALRDPHAGVRRHALRLAEPLLRAASGPDTAGGARRPSPEILAQVLGLARDNDAALRFQLALSLGEWRDPRAGEALGALSVRGADDPWLRAAVLSSAVHAVDPIVRALLREAPDTEFRAHFFANLIATSAGSGALADLALLSERLAPPPGVAPARWQLAGLAAVLEEARRRGEGLESLARTQHSEARGLLARLRGVLNAARGTASDEAAGDEDRTAALPLLGLDTAAEDDDLRELARLLDARQSPAVQSAALRAFARSRRDEAAGHLVAAWESAAPALRPQLTEALLSREVWTRRLVQAMEDGSVPPAEIDASRRERLIQHTVAELATRARKLFEPLGRPTRQELLEKYRHVLQLAGDRGQGAPVFARLCAACHAFKGQGKAVGPDLAALADRGAEALLIAVLDPNAAVEDKYLSFTLVAADGSVRSGMVAEETATSVALVQTDGSREVVLRKDIRSLRSTGKSLMPEGMEKDLDPQALADIVAYLQSGPRTLGSVTPAEAARARESLRALDVNGLDAVEGEGEAFPQPSWLGTVPMRYCRQTDGTWTLRWRSAPLAQDLPVGAAHRLRLAAAMGYRSQPAGGFQLRVNGRHVLDFDVAVDDAAWQSADGAVRMLYTVYANNSEDSTGVLAFELAPSLVEPGKPVELEVTGGAAGSQRWFGVLLWPGRG